jgi:hypothetical protein
MERVMDLGPLLRESDPIAAAPAMPADEAQRMRRLVVAEVDRPAPAWWPRPIAVAATVAGMLAGGVAVGTRLPGRPPAPRAGAVVAPAPVAPRRQVQFATPGGTRIIWVIDPDFDL